MVDDRKSQALVIYVSKDTSPFPCEDPDGVVRGFPEDGVDLIAYVEGVLREMRSVPVDWETETYRDSIERVTNEMARRHPELSKEAVDAISWVFSYDWK